MNNPLVSIIVPVYNRELSIGYCLDSILNLSISNFELIIVDDGSTDNTNNVCKHYMQGDSRIKLITNSNKGVSAARNVGIISSIGEWITFIDSDDVVLPSHLDVLQNKSHADLMMTRRSDIQYSNNHWNSVKYDEGGYLRVEGNRQIVDYLFGEYNPYVNPIYSCIDKFFKRDIIDRHGLKFNQDIFFGEDQIFVLEYLKYVTSFVFHRSVTYLCVSYDFDVNHLSSSLKSYEKFYQCIMGNFTAFSPLFEQTKSEDLKAYSYHYLYDRLISRILYRFRDFPYKGVYPKLPLAQFIDEKIKPILVKHRKNLKYVRKPSVRFFSFIIIHGSAHLAIWVYDCMLSLYKVFLKITKSNCFGRTI